MQHSLMKYISIQMVRCDGNDSTIRFSPMVYCSLHFPSHKSLMFNDSLPLYWHLYPFFHSIISLMNGELDLYTLIGIGSSVISISHSLHFTVVHSPAISKIWSSKIKSPTLFNFKCLHTLLIFFSMLWKSS